MPEYTKEQIDKAKEFLSLYSTEQERDTLKDRERAICKAVGGVSDGGHYRADVIEHLQIVYQKAQERDEANAKADQYKNDWYAAKTEFGDITAKLRDRVRTAEARCAELEARLQGAADRAIKWQTKLCEADHWSCKNCTECTDLRAAIEGKEVPSAV